MHRLLERQIKRFFGDPAALPPEIAALAAAVDEAYAAADADRLMIERSLDLMSKELTETNNDLRRQLTERNQVEKLLLNEKEEQKALIKKLEDAHNQLLQSEKMASIGQLAAGVAHEINNPIGYVNSNLGTLRTYFDQLLTVLSTYETLESTCEPAKLAQISAVKKEMELEFLKEDILALLKESGEGIQRVKQIVQDLKDFSHVDEAEWQQADLHHGLDSTLNVVHNEIKYKADVVKEYGDIPRVECLPSQINQVFMNLLVNAAHAMDENKRGLITIRSGMTGDEVWVEIADDGKGIPPENLNRIFDPFFTTKPVGKGTGLGLSLSYGIIEKHHGRIEVHSEVGQGTTFRIWLSVGGPGVSTDQVQ